MDWKARRKLRRSEGRVFRDTRAYRNTAEEAVRETLIRQGFRVTKRGWPDFFAIREGDKDTSVLLVEVKRSPRVPSAAQRMVLDTLATKFRVSVAVVDGQDVRFHPYPYGKD